MSATTLAALCSLTFVGVFALIAAQIVRNVRRLNRDSLAPKTEAPAAVTARRTGSAPGKGKQPEQYYVTFQTDTGETVELRVPRSDYLRLTAGQRGILTRQGGHFVDFRLEG